LAKRLQGGEDLTHHPLGLLCVPPPESLVERPAHASGSNDGGEIDQGSFDGGGRDPILDQDARVIGWPTPVDDRSWDT
jgi:hypothetical protein